VSSGDHNTRRESAAVSCCWEAPYITLFAMAPSQLARRLLRALINPIASRVCVDAHRCCGRHRQSGLAATLLDAAKVSG